MSAISIGSLTVALVLFLLSTRQLLLWRRATIWSLGLLALLCSLFFVARDNGHSGLFRAIADLAEHWTRPQESILFDAWRRNGPNVDRFLLPLLDLFILFAATLGCLALTAFTPGQALERVARPLIIGCIGCIVGGAITLTVVGIGFGAPLKQRAYANLVRGSDIHDGDTFWIGEISVRLNGVDAPELQQLCRNGNAIERCGEASARHLSQLIQNAVVTCLVEENGTGRAQDSFGRPLATCEASRDGRRFDVGHRMIRDGYAVQYGGGPSPTALRDRLGIMGSCSISPSTWRRNRSAREAFVATGALPNSPQDRMGSCPAT